MTEKLLCPKDRALRAVGRAIANFQRLEFYVKLLALTAPIGGSPQALEIEQAKRKERSSKLTLGGAIADWKKLLVGEVQHPALNGDLFDATLRASISFGISPEVASPHIAELEALLDERNILIHRGLLAMDWNDQKTCESLFQSLTAQHERIATQLRFVEPLVRGVFDMKQALAEAVASEEFARFLNTEYSDDVV